MSISNTLKIDSLNKICRQILNDQNIRCYFCRISGKRWAFLAGDEDIMTFPKRYAISDNLGILADGEIENLDKYLKKMDIISINQS